MESWFLADRQTLMRFFGDGFRDKSLPSHAVLEEIGKDAVIQGLARASKPSRKGEHDKGNHSFKLMEMIDPGKVESALPSAGRLFSRLRG